MVASLLYPHMPKGEELSCLYPLVRALIPWGALLSWWCLKLVTSKVLSPPNSTLGLGLQHMNCGWGVPTNIQSIAWESNLWLYFLKIKWDPRLALKGHPPFAPGVPAQVGQQRRPPGLSAACACLPRLWWPLLAVSWFLEATDTPHPSHPAPPRFPGPSLPPCLVVKTLTPRAGPADTWSPSQKHGTYFSD